jgi:hypothetical protein
MKTKYMNLAFFIFYFFSHFWRLRTSKIIFSQNVSPLKKKRCCFLVAMFFFPPIVLNFFLAIDHSQENLTKFGCIPDMESKTF